MLINWIPGACRSDQWTCSNGDCIDALDRCNGYRQCSDGSDEDNCI